MPQYRWFALCFGTSLMFAQTLVDLRTQAKTVDFSGANATKPFKSGVVLPSTCQVGEMFYNTAAVAGANLYGCTALNSWTLQSGTLLPSVFKNNGKILSTDGTNLVWSGPGGDLSGSISSMAVVGLQGRSISTAQPSSGQVLVWNATTSKWEPQTPSSGGTPGVSLASQLGDFAVVKTSSTTLTIGANCSISTPCNVRFGSNTYTFNSGANVTLNGATGLAYIYISSSGSLTVGTNLNVTCMSGCVAQGGVTAFPASSIPIWLWSATAGTWDAAGVDSRAFLSAKNIVAGAGISAIDQSGQTIIALDPTIASVQVAAPATASASCAQGSWATDASYYYLCVSNNVWKRAALASW